jgi:Fic family protein
MVNEIDEHYTIGSLVPSVLKEQRETHMKGGIYHLNQIDMAYNSNRIEGSKLSHEQTRYIYETDTVLGDALVNDVIEVVNHFKLFDYMLDHINDPVSSEKLKEYHRVLKGGTKDVTRDWFVVGDWKQLENTVGEANAKTTPPERVESEMTSLLERLPDGAMSFDQIIDFHVAFESIHPFQDGNGRIGRIIMFEQCLQNDILPFIVLDDQKAYYYRGLQNYKTEKDWLLDTCRSFQDDYHKRYRKYIPVPSAPSSLRTRVAEA